MFNASEREALAGIARAALEAAVSGKRYVPPEHFDSPALLAKCGCFVTLKTDGRLRGCLGCFVSDQPIVETVAEYARLSALEDPRFGGNRIRPAELGKVDIDISILSPLEPCENPHSIIPGTHGVYVRQGRHSGCFLPQVATETGWNVDEFWGHCCRDKAGLAWDAWTKPGVELYVFTAEII